MDDKKAAEILMALLKKQILDSNEREALGIAIGILSWTSLSKSRLKSLRKKQNDKAKKSCSW